jgi:hypothetical protein
MDRPHPRITLEGALHRPFGSSRERDGGESEVLRELHEVDEAGMLKRSRMIAKDLHERHQGLDGVKHILSG